MATLQEDILRQTGVTLPDGRRYQRGVITSASDAARTDATRARNAAFDAEATSRQIGMPLRPAAPVIPDGQITALGPRPASSISPLGDSPVAKAVMANLPSLGLQASPGASGPVDVNAYSDSRYGDNVSVPPAGQPSAPGAPQAGYGATRLDPGINVTGYAGSRYDPNFAANNPQAPLEAPDIAMAKALLKASQSSVPGRVYNDRTLSAATPQQIAIEAALLPQRQQQAAADTEGAALQEAFNVMRGGAQPGQSPELGDVTAALGRAPGSPQAVQPAAPPDVAAAVQAYVAKGGRDPKRIEEIRQTGEAAAKAIPKQPNTPQAVTLTYPDGTAVKGVWDGNNFSQEKQPPEQTPTMLGRLISERDAAIKSGRTDLVAAYDSAIAAQGKQDGLSAQDLIAAVSGGRAPAVAQATAIGAPAVSTVKTKAERDALAPGTRYTGPDGKVYTKK